MYKPLECQFFETQCIVYNNVRKKLFKTQDSSLMTCQMSMLEDYWIENILVYKYRKSETVLMMKMKINNRVSM